MLLVKASLPWSWSVSRAQKVSRMDHWVKAIDTPWMIL